ncbi:hypothetical protein F9C07_3030 [Aspergillus flavus]|uniref:Uncharacterized protein n=1 Tax=Aspergillus flavus (strain ATCC 200026 / FGSC A1120 / IAM 13836 / NRRL 3357 / JCM 12722 / SRRC 167) TaxID=332952 RepID=A0A7U2ME36_ASPFN|nr:hypothetical protein F9C07_3030 [Aspergillus flavus]
MLCETNSMREHSKSHTMFVLASLPRRTEPWYLSENDGDMSGLSTTAVSFFTSLSCLFSSLANDEFCQGNQISASASLTI